MAVFDGYLVKLTPAQITYLRECVYIDLECTSDDNMEIGIECLRKFDCAMSLYLP